MEEKDGVLWRRIGMELQFHINVNLDPKIAIKVFKACYEVERNLFLIGKKRKNPTARTPEGKGPPVGKKP